MELIIQLISTVYNFLWGDLFTIPLPGGGSAGISLLVLLLIPTGIYFTIRTRVLPVRMFPEMLRLTVEKRTGERGHAISGLQTLIVSTATRVGMGNLVGVVAAISAGGAGGRGAVFWMWVSALLGSSTAFVEATLAQLYKEKDPLYGGYRGGPAYYIHAFVQRKLGGKKRRYSLVAVLFAISGLICWCGISQVISNSVSSAFENAFQVPPLYSTLLLVLLAAVIVLRKNATVKVLDVLVPVMAGCYFLITVVLLVKNAALLPSVFQRIFEEAFGIRQVGQKAAKVLAMHFGTLDKLMAATEDELMAIPDVGPTTAAYLRAWFDNTQSQHQIRLLRDAGVSFDSKEQVVDRRFAGKTFVLTGALEHFSRDEASAIIERFGGKTSSSVSKKTSYLLAGENTGSKYQKALTLGTPIITEAEFLDMIQE